MHCQMLNIPLSLSFLFCYLFLLAEDWIMFALFIARAPIFSKPSLYNVYIYIYIYIYIHIHIHVRISIRRPLVGHQAAKVGLKCSYFEVLVRLAALRFEVLVSLVAS